MYFPVGARLGQTGRRGSGEPMADQTGPDDDGTRIAVASYVATLSADLSVMARRNGLDALGYILEMARLEVESAARHMPHGPNGGR